MLLANVFEQSVGNFFAWTILLLVIANLFAKKLFAANPEVTDAAKKAATAKMLQLIGRFFK